MNIILVMNIIFITNITNITNIIKEIYIMKNMNITTMIKGELHRDIRIHCLSQGITMKNFIPELINKGWQFINGDITNMLYNDDGSPQK